MIPFDSDVKWKRKAERRCARKQSASTKTGFEKLRNNKPLVYKILTADGKNNYAGVAERGRVHERLQKHLPRGKDHMPQTKVQIKQMASIKAAEAKSR